jgi:hypothetical protein
MIKAFAGFQKWQKCGILHNTNEKANPLKGGDAML